MQSTSEGGSGGSASLGEKGQAGEAGFPITGLRSRPLVLGHALALMCKPQRGQSSLLARLGRLRAGSPGLPLASCRWRQEGRRKLEEALVAQRERKEAEAEQADQAGVQQAGGEQSELAHEQAAGGEEQPALGGSSEVEMAEAAAQ